MKRGAEKQLSKDDNPDDEVEVRRLIYNPYPIYLSVLSRQEVQTGFQVAKESELERRECVLSLLVFAPPCIRAL